MLNKNLDKLKQTFDRIESYDPTLNIGLRSIKNIGVWLCAYALTEANDQKRVIAELAGIHNNPIEVSNLKHLVDSLTTPTNLQACITDYETANGSFTLTVENEANRKRLERKIVERGLQDVLLSHVGVDSKQSATLIFLMQNMITFNWAAASKHGSQLSSAEFTQTVGEFKGEVSDYLEADSEDHDVRYGLIDHNGHLYHVVDFKTLQINKTGPVDSTRAYLIEPVVASDAACLQKNYFSIIDDIKTKGFNPKKTFELLQANKSQTSQVTVKGELSQYPSFHFIVRFPQIAAALKTVEERLGIYAPFLGKTIGNFFAETIGYHGERELTYDEKGGEIKNKEVFAVLESCFKKSGEVTMTYNVTNPFMMVYEAVNGSDYYPYFIADPKVNLENKFEHHQVYAKQILPGMEVKGFATGPKLFDPVTQQVYVETPISPETMKLYGSRPGN